MINYNHKKFRPADHSKNSETSAATVFEYFQEGSTIWAHYAGGSIAKGHLIGTVDNQGNIDMRYHHLNTDGELMTGTCVSTPEVLPSGKIRLHEKWQWTSGDHSEGSSVIEEIE